MSRRDDAELLDARLRERGEAARIEHSKDELDGVYADVLTRLDVPARVPVTASTGEPDGNVLIDGHEHTRRRRPAFRVLYESNKITITSWDIRVNSLRINVSELGAVERHLTYGYPTIKVAAIAAGLELAIAAPFAVAYGSAMMIGVGLLSVCGMAVGALNDFRKNPRYQEIHATLRGRRVVLFGTRDHRIFKFVWRALVRAIEDNRLRYPYD